MADRPKLLGVEQEPSVPVAQLRAAVALLSPDEMTPTAKRMLLSICDQHTPDSGDDLAAR